jgi:hydroxypyruvate isomerase
MIEYSIEDLCKIAVSCGLKAIDLAGPRDWPILKSYHLEASMCNGAEIGLTRGWSDVQYHEVLIRNYMAFIDLVAKSGYKNIICFSGNKNGMSYESGLKNCARGLKQILGLAEKRGVTLHMELFNSKTDHPDYMCDSTVWGVELCKMLDSDNFKLLFDIYHMHVQEGDVINTIRDYSQYFGHYHTAGVPGRHEPNGFQELNHAAIAAAIASTGFTGYIGHEYIPTQANKESRIKDLREAVRIYGDLDNENNPEVNQAGKCFKRLVL